MTAIRTQVPLPGRLVNYENGKLHRDFKILTRIKGWEKTKSRIQLFCYVSQLAKPYWEGRLIEDRKIDRNYMKFSANF